MARHWNPIMMNAVLFGHRRCCTRKRAKLGLTGEQMRLLERTYTNFYAPAPASTRSPRSGEPRSTSGWPSSAPRSATTCSATSRTGSWSSARTTAPAFPEPSSPRPRRPRKSGACEGKAIVTLSRSSVEPFLKSSVAPRPAREGLQGLHRARRDNGNANDNNATIVEILELREEAAKIMGFPTYAAYRLEDSMAKTPEAVRSLLGAGLEARARARPTATPCRR